MALGARHDPVRVLEERARVQERREAVRPAEEPLALQRLAQLADEERHRREGERVDDEVQDPDRRMGEVEPGQVVRQDADERAGQGEEESDPSLRVPGGERERQVVHSLDAEIDAARVFEGAHREDAEPGEHRVKPGWRLPALGCGRHGVPRAFSRPRGGGS